MSKGRVWGEDMILATESLRLTATARAMNYLEAYYLARDEVTAAAARRTPRGPSKARRRRPRAASPLARPVP